MSCEREEIRNITGGLTQDGAVLSRLTELKLPCFGWTQKLHLKQEVDQKLKSKIVSHRQKQNISKACSNLWDR